MLRKSRRVLLGLLAVLVLALLALIGFTAGRPPARPALPNPNGYDDFIKARTAVTGGFGAVQVPDYDKLAAFVSANAEALHLIRLGLSRPCAKPMDSEPKLADLLPLLAAEGRLREMDNRPGDAARSYTDAIRLGNEVSRGGEPLDRLLGMAFESVGHQGLVKLAPMLGGRDAHVVLTELEAVDAARVSWPDVLWAQRRSEIRRMLRHPIAWARTQRKVREGVEEGIGTQHKLVMAKERLIAVELALRLCQVEQGRAPAHLRDLVPKHLSKVPEDPFSGRAVIYRPQGTNWLLYSIGPDGVDDGGRPAGRGWPLKGDILFDSSW
jgi:hypothetical protein